GLGQQRILFGRLRVEFAGRGGGKEFAEVLLFVLRLQRRVKGRRNGRAPNGAGFSSRGGTGAFESGRRGGVGSGGGGRGRRGGRVGVRVERAERRVERTNRRAAAPTARRRCAASRSEFRSTCAKRSALSGESCRAAVICSWRGGASPSESEAVRKLRAANEEV